MMMTSLETLKISFALDIKLFDESVSRDIGTEGMARRRRRMTDRRIGNTSNFKTRLMSILITIQKMVGKSPLQLVEGAIAAVFIEYF
jgi:hypothetical protein